MPSVDVASPADERLKTEVRWGGSDYVQIGAATSDPAVCARLMEDLGDPDVVAGLWVQHSLESLDEVIAALQRARRKLRRRARAAAAHAATQT